MVTIATERLEWLTRRLEGDVGASLIPGATVAVGHANGLVFEASVGFRDVATRDPLRHDAIWRIFSMTKPVVTAAAMVFAERGALRLDQPVADFIPAFGHQRVAGPDGAHRAAESLPTVQDLMRHTAGLAYGYLTAGPAGQALVDDGFLHEDLPLADFVERLAALPLAYQPGTTWHYSHATDVLGRILEIVGGDSLDAVLRATILDPLGMPDTAFQVPGSERSRIAEPLPQPPGARPRFFDPCAKRRHRSGGGGLVSTVADYARFLRMMLGRGTLEGQRLLSPAAVALMTADHLGPSFRHAAYYPPGPGYGFGLGFAVRIGAGQAPFPGSIGDCYWSGVGGTYFWIDPAQDLFALFMLQSSSADQRQHYRTLTRTMVYAALG